MEHTQKNNQAHKNEGQRVRWEKKWGCRGGSNIELIPWVLHMEQKNRRMMSLQQESGCFWNNNYTN